MSINQPNYENRLARCGLPPHTAMAVVSLIQHVAGAAVGMDTIVAGQVRNIPLGSLSAILGAIQASGEVRLKPRGVRFMGDDGYTVRPAGDLVSFIDESRAMLPDSRVGCTVFFSKVSPMIDPGMRMKVSYSHLGPTGLRVSELMNYTIEMDVIRPDQPQSFIAREGLNGRTLKGLLEILRLPVVDEAITTTGVLKKLRDHIVKSNDSSGLLSDVGGQLSFVNDLPRESLPVTIKFKRGIANIDTNPSVSQAREYVIRTRTHTWEIGIQHDKEVQIQTVFLTEARELQLVTTRIVDVMHSDILPHFQQHLGSMPPQQRPVQQQQPVNITYNLQTNDTPLAMLALQNLQQQGFLQHGQIEQFSALMREVDAMVRMGAFRQLTISGHLGGRLMVVIHSALSASPIGMELPYHHNNFVEQQARQVQQESQPWWTQGRDGGSIL